MEIVFKSGERVNVSVEIVKALKDIILNNNVGDFQIFNDMEDQPFLIIKLSEVLYIH